MIMNYEPYDSSGTDDDLPPSHHGRVPKGGCTAGNGRSALVASTPYPGICAENMEVQIHQLEKEAYLSVLRAFKAQADAITWEKESLITELRRELRISNEDHRELLGRVNADGVIQRIREWRQAGGAQSAMLGAIHVVEDQMPSPTILSSRKKPKMNHSLPSQSFGAPSPQFHAQVVAASNQPSSSAAKRGSMMSSKGKKNRSDLVSPAVSSGKSMQYPSSNASGRGQIPNQGRPHLSDAADAATSNPLIGRKVRTRWPDDNNFYEAVITEYNPVEGLHALVYDMGTAKETWEWVNLSEISPEDIQWVGEDPRISRRGGYDTSNHVTNGHLGSDNAPGGGRGKGGTRGHGRKDFPPSHNGIEKKKTSDDIQILHTDTLIKEVERIFSTTHPNPIEVERATKVLREHEQSLLDAIRKLADLSDRESC